MLTASLDALSPLKVLTRGYTAAFDGNGKVVRSVSDLGAGDTVDLLLADGRAGCTVNTVSPGTVL